MGGGGERPPLLRGAQGGERARHVALPAALTGEMSGFGWLQGQSALPYFTMRSTHLNLPLALPRRRRRRHGPHLRREASGARGGLWGACARRPTGWGACSVGIPASLWHQAVNGLFFFCAPTSPASVCWKRSCSSLYRSCSCEAWLFRPCTVAPPTPPLQGGRERERRRERGGAGAAVSGPPSATARMLPNASAPRSGTLSLVAPANERSPPLLEWRKGSPLHRLLSAPGPALRTCDARPFRSCGRFVAASKSGAGAPGRRTKALLAPPRAMRSPGLQACLELLLITQGAPQTRSAQRKLGPRRPGPSRHAVRHRRPAGARPPLHAVVACHRVI